MTTYTINATPLTGSTPSVVTCTASSSDGSPFVITWDFGDGSPRVTGSYVTYTYNTQGTYTLTGAVTNGTSESFTITPVGPLVASFTQDTTNLYVNGTVNFTDTSTGNPLQWQWNFGDGSDYDYTQNPSHTYTVPGIYAVNLLVNDQPPPIAYRYWSLEIRGFRQPDGSIADIGGNGIAGMRFRSRGTWYPLVPLTSNNTPSPYVVTGTPSPSEQYDLFYAFQNTLIYESFYYGSFYDGDIGIRLNIDLGESIAADEVQIALVNGDSYPLAWFDIQASHTGNFDGGDYVVKYINYDYTDPWPSYQYVSLPLNLDN